MLTEREIEALAEEAIRAAGFDPADLPDAVRLARRLVGPVRTFAPACLPGDAVLARVGGERRIYVRGRLPPIRLRWAVLHECAEALLEGGGYRERDVEVVADRLAASLGVPRPAARKACRQRGPEWRQLALDFRTTQSCAALRFGEVTGWPTLLVTPKSVRDRGEPYHWPSNEELLTRRKIPGIVKTKLRDAPKRVAARPA